MFGKRLKDLLDERDMKQKELAEKIGVHEVTISRYISGSHIPQPELLKKIAQVLNTTIDYLMFGKTTNGSKLDFSPLENFVKEFEKLSDEDRNKVFKKLVDRVLEDKKNNDITKRLK